MGLSVQSGYISLFILLLSVSCGLLTASKIVCETWTSFIICLWGSLLTLIMGVCVLDMGAMHPSASHSVKTLLVQYIFTRLMTYKGRLALRQMTAKAKDVKRSQEAILSAILSDNSDTLYGRQHGFSDSDTVSDFRANHRLTTYSDMEEYAEKIARGEQHVLTRDPVTYIALSTGTTGRNKRLPVTGAMRRQAIGTVRPIMTYVTQRMGLLNLQRPFVLFYKSHTTTSDGGLHMGPISQHVFRYMPYAVSPKAAFNVYNEQTALHVHAVFALRERHVGNIEALMATLVYSFFRYLDDHWQAVCDDIADGRISRAPRLTDSRLLDELNAHLRPDNTRAEELRREFRLGAAGIGRRIWPNLGYSRMLTSGGFAHHAKALAECHLSGVSQLSLLHVASESFMGINISCTPNTCTYTALPHCSFVEFIPDSLIYTAQPETRLLHEVELKQQYEVVLTTPMGLYRYRTGDVIKITGFYHQCPVYEFQHRVGQVLNLYWEKTTEDILYRAIEDTEKSLQWSITDYTATEDLHLSDLLPGKQVSPKCYVFFVEMAKRDDDTVRYLTDSEKEEFDAALRHTFALYDSMRQSDSIGPPVVLQVAPGCFLRLKARMLADRGDTQQFKMPRVLRHRLHLEYLVHEVITNN